MYMDIYIWIYTHFVYIYIYIPSPSPIACPAPLAPRTAPGPSAGQRWPIAVRAEPSPGPADGPRTHGWHFASGWPEAVSNCITFTPFPPLPALPPIALLLPFLTGHCPTLFFGAAS